MEEYQHKFQPLLARAHSITGAQQMEIFTVELTELNKIDVELQNPFNFAMAISLAKTFEKKKRV